jgi:hypothetical protein
VHRYNVSLEQPIDLNILHYLLLQSEKEKKEKERRKLGVEIAKFHHNAYSERTARAGSCSNASYSEVQTAGVSSSSQNQMGGRRS